MSNIVNDQILENIAEEVNAMSNISIVNEVLDKFFSFADMDSFKDRLILKRFEEMSQ
jgi:hypothetical protein